jgi:hypothetical protein
MPKAPASSDLPLIHTDFRTSPLPNRRAEPEFASCPKCKTSLDQLNRFLQGHLRAHRDPHVDVVRYDHKFVEKIFPLLAMVTGRVDQ